MCVCVYMYIHIYVYVCVCVCIKWKKESTKAKGPGAHESLACIRVCSVALLCLTLWGHMDYGPPGSSGDSPGKNTGVGCRAFLQGIFPTQGSNSSLLTTLALAGGFFTTSTTWEAPWKPYCGPFSSFPFLGFYNKIRRLNWKICSSVNGFME